ncbi:MAG: NAD(P)-dependent oxidoreductase [bacterium]
MDYSLPLLWKCKGLAVVAEGEGPAFARRLFALIEAGAQVTLYSPEEPCLEISLWVAGRRLRRRRRRLRKGDLAKAHLLLLASQDRTRSRRLAAWARAVKCRTACLSHPAEGDLRFSASVRGGGLLGAFWDERGEGDRLAFLRRRLQRALPRWLDQARRARAKPARRWIRGWIS